MSAPLSWDGIVHIAHPTPRPLATAVPHCRHVWGVEDSREFRFRGTTHCLLITITQVLSLFLSICTKVANPAALHSTGARTLPAVCKATQIPRHFRSRQVRLTSTRFARTTLEQPHARDTVSASNRSLEKLGSRAAPQDPWDEMHALDAEAVTNALLCACTSRATSHAQL